MRWESWRKKQSVHGRLRVEPQLLCIAMAPLQSNDNPQQLAVCPLKGLNWDQMPFLKEVFIPTKQRAGTKFICAADEITFPPLTPGSGIAG